MTKLYLLTFLLAATSARAGQSCYIPEDVLSCARLDGNGSAMPAPNYDRGCSISCDDGQTAACAPAECSALGEFTPSSCTCQ